MEFPTYPNETEEERRAESIGLVFANLSQEAYANAVRHGFDNTPGEDIALMHSELSEALEELRNPGHRINETYYNLEKPTKPEGVPAELADVLIRVFDFCGKHKIDIAGAVIEKMAYNATRPYKHGGKAL